MTYFRALFGKVAGEWWDKSKACEQGREKQKTLKILPAPISNKYSKMWN